MIHGPQGRGRDAPIKHKLYQADTGQENITLRTLKRKNVVQGSSREWEKLGVGKVRPESWGPYSGS